jgi:hypothetical protein
VLSILIRCTVFKPLPPPPTTHTTTGKPALKIFTTSLNNKTTIAPQYQPFEAEVFGAFPNTYDQGAGFNPNYYMPMDEFYAQHYPNDPIPAICDSCSCGMMGDLDCSSNVPGIAVTGVNEEIFVDLANGVLPSHFLNLWLEYSAFTTLSKAGFGSTLHDRIAALSFWVNAITSVEAGTFANGVWCSVFDTTVCWWMREHARGSICTCLFGVTVF